MGLHIKMDKLLLDCADWCCILSPLLQLFIHELAVVVITEDCTTIIELRGYFDELPRFSCDSKIANQGHSTQGIQGSRNGSFALE